MEDVQSSRFCQRIRTHQQELMTQRDFDIMDGYGDGNVTPRAEFFEFMLVAPMNKIDRSLVDELRKHFDRLDINHCGTGELTREDYQCQLWLTMYKHRLLL
jgi:hypothetical protein